MINFYASSKRHFNDASKLEELGSIPNAGQLFGISAECGIKSLLVALGHPTTSGHPTAIDGDITFNLGFRKHIDQLQSAYSNLLSYLTGRTGGHYLAMIPSLSHFSDWKVEHRYFLESSIPNSIEKWIHAAVEVQYMVDQANLDGIIT